MPDYRYLRYETLDDGRIVRVLLDRPEARNAQNRGLLTELDDALLRAEADDDVRVVILGGVGPVFSSGHDLGSRDAREEMAPGPGQHPSYRSNGATLQGTERRMRQEWHYFFHNTLRWRNLRKITIGQAQGSVLAGGLMLLWCCDLIVAAEGTVFADVVGTRLGMCGLEYFGHPWELGVRRAKELLLTGDSIDADEAYRLGMVSKVFASDRLEALTLEYARRISSLPSVTSLLVKESVNQAQDNMGFYNALQSAFTLHQVNHAHWAEVNEDGAPFARLEDWRSGPGVQAAERSRP
jgi:enoyl-CoA hydratase